MAYDPQTWTKSTPTTGHTITANTWTHVGSVYNGSNVVIYKNASGITPVSATQTPPSSGFGNTSIGRAGSYNGIYQNGSLDEIRIRASALSANWITTEYNNQSSPSTFYFVGPQETDGAPPAADSTDGGVIWFD